MQRIKIKRENKKEHHPAASASVASRNFVADAATVLLLRLRADALALRAIEAALTRLRSAAVMRGADYSP